MSELAKALVDAQKAMPAVPKNATADTDKFSYSYVTLDSLIAKTLPVLNEHGLAITQAPEHIEGFGLGLRTTLTHTSGETSTSVMPIPHAGHSMQDLGGAITYARRYAWASVLGIAAEHDDDAGAITHTQTFVQPKAAAPEPAQTAAAPAVASNDPGAVVLTFGKHKDTPIKNVPRPYLEWWIAQEPPKTDAQRVQRAAAELFLLGATDDVLATPVPDEDIPF